MEEVFRQLGSKWVFDLKIGLHIDLKQFISQIFKPTVISLNYVSCASNRPAYLFTILFSERDGD